MSDKVYCEKCKSSKVSIDINNYICFKCGFKGRCVPEHLRKLKLFDKTGIVIDYSKNETRSKYFESDCPTTCPKCESKDIDKKETYILCKKCGFFGSYEVFEGV